MTEIIDGRRLAEKIKDKITQEIYRFNGLRPNLAIILVGEREDSKLYVSLKEKEGRKVGVDTHLYRLPETVSEKELAETIEFLNNDPLIDSILIQLPLPPNLNTDGVINQIDPRKDADGFHPRHPEYIVSPVLASVRACLEETKISFAGKKAKILYNSEVFGDGLKKMLKEFNIDILPDDSREEADLLISALGKPHFVKAEMIKPKAVVIDIGITKVEGHVLGDVDFESVKDKVAYVTPVPGGIGPMTIAFLFQNVLEIFKRRK